MTDEQRILRLEKQVGDLRSMLTEIAKHADEVDAGNVRQGKAIFALMDSLNGSIGDLARNQCRIAENDMASIRSDYTQNIILFLHSVWLGLMTYKLLWGMA